MTTPPPDVGSPWSCEAAQCLATFDVAADRGLDPEQAGRRLHRHGRNRLRKNKKRSALGILGGQLCNVIILLLAAAAVVAWGFGQGVEAAAIVVAVGLNVAFGFFTELRATRSMEAFSRMSGTKTTVRRNGTVFRIFSEKIVPGDIVLLEQGDMVPADLRLLEASRLAADESALTGESMPIAKQTRAVEKNAVLSERRSMLFKGTAIVGGSGCGVVTATGMNTELGRIAALAEAATPEETPLEKRLNRFGYRLIVLTFLVAVLVFAAGIAGRQPWRLMIETAIALAVAAAPEGLPVVATIALARGLWRLLRHNALMNRLSAVETLGSTSVICTDKTGTLTENHMAVTCLAALAQAGKDPAVFDVNAGDGQIALRGREVGFKQYPVLEKILETGVLCSNAILGDDGKEESGKVDSLGSHPGNPGVGDPMEIALLRIGADWNRHRDALLEKWPEVREEAFDPQTKMMATVHGIENGAAAGYRVAVKGAPGAVLDVCDRVLSGEKTRPMDDNARESLLACNHRMAAQGLRVLAAAEKTVADPAETPYGKLTFLGLVGMQDPPRRGVAEALDACRAAGIHVVMVTGDQAPTAVKIARMIGLVKGQGADVVQGHMLKDIDGVTAKERRRLLDARVFARVSPEQKLVLISLHQENGAVVAMTGDGVNDAPALKKADIGIAMGMRGTQVARQAADMVLKDDAFQTLVTAIAQGRAIFSNIRKFIFFLLSGNVGEILIVGIAVIAGAPLPLLPLQILYLNMIGDVFPALALAVGEGDPGKMKEPPRKSGEAILTGGHWLAIGGYGLVICGAVLAAFTWALRWGGMDASRAVTVSFLTLSFARLWHVFNMRSPRSGILANEIGKNPFMWGALGISVALLVAAVHVPVLSGVLKLSVPDAGQWGAILLFSLVPLAVGQAALGITRRVRARTAPRGEY